MQPKGTTYGWNLSSKWLGQDKFPTVLYSGKCVRAGGSAPPDATAGSLMAIAAEIKRSSASIGLGVSRICAWKKNGGIGAGSPYPEKPQTVRSWAISGEARRLWKTMEKTHTTSPRLEIQLTIDRLVD
jgi:hypothetical protein